MKKKMFLTVLALACLLMAAVARAWAAAPETVATGLEAPVGMAFDAQGRLWVAEWGADRVVLLDERGERAATINGISRPAGLAFDAAGTLHIAGYGDGRIYAWTPGGGLAVVAEGLAAPTGLYWSAETGLLAANRNAGEILRLLPGGGTEVISAGHRLPVGVARLADGRLAVSCYGGGIDLVAPDGAVRPLASPGLVRPGVGIVAAGPERGPDGLVVVDNGAGAVASLGRGAPARVLAGGLASPVGLCRAPDGRLHVATWGDGTVRALAGAPRN